VPGHTERSIRIRAPFRLVWDMTNDVENWPNLFTEYASAEILEQRGDSVRFRLTMRPDEQGRVWSWVSERTPDLATRQVEAHRVETGPFEHMRIRWTYEEDGDATTLTWVQDFAMRADAPLDDAGMAQHIERNSDIQLEVIRQKVEAAAARQQTNPGGRDRMERLT
jgi:aromatase